jgi:hypothetical protein
MVDMPGAGVERGPSSVIISPRRRLLHKLGDMDILPAQGLVCHCSIRPVLISIARHPMHGSPVKLVVTLASTFGFSHLVSFSSGQAAA